MKKILFALVPFLLTAMTANAQIGILDGQVIVNPPDVFENGGKVYVSFSMDVSGLEVETDKEVILTPELRDTAGNVEALPEIWLVGRNRYFYQMRNGNAVGNEHFYRKKNLSKVLYDVNVPYEPWMKYADLVITEDVCGCSELIASNEDMLFSPFIPLYVYVSPPVDMVKVRNITGSAFIDFPVSQTVIYPDYRSNPEELEKIRRTIDVVKNDPDADIIAISIKGYASPESPYDNNTRLAKGRTAALKEYVRELYHFSDEIFTTSYEPEDWAGLRKYVASSNLESREGILKWIDTDMDPDEKELSIKKNYPEDYAFLLHTCYPALRHSDYEVKYILRSYTDIEEMKRVLATAPGKLSLYEMYQIASTYEKGSDEYNELVSIMVHLYPDDEVANLNAATVAISCGDLKSARKYIGKSGTRPEAVYTEGLLLAVEGRYEEAIPYIEKARDAGVPEAAECMERIERADL